MTISLNTITTQSALNEQAPAAQKGTSLGLYRTFGYVGAILAGSQLKTIFHGGVTNGSFATVQRYTLLSGLLLVGLYLLLLQQEQRARAERLLNA